MKTRLPADLFALLQHAGATADRQQIFVCAVGGFVRDLLLAIPNFDVDLVVEGDGIRFAHAFAKPSRARVTIHQRFGTAAVTFADGHTVDIATARTESYDAPAALPTVQRSSLTRDGSRRDFTINTLAVRLNAAHFGELVDRHGGQQDLREGTIRVLHRLSFREDPTRVFRAIRFEQRLGFHLDRDTADLMRHAVREKHVHRLSPSRLSNELRHVLSERKPGTVLARLADFRLLPCIHPTLKWSPRLARLLNAIETAIDRHARLSHGRPLHPWVVYGMALLDPLPRPAVEEVLARLTFPRRQAQSLVWVARQGDRLLRTLNRRTPVNPSRIFRMLCGLPDETLVFLLAKTRSATGKRRLEDMFTVYRRVAPVLTGNDLRAMGVAPGPIYQRVLDRLLDARLDGTVNTEADERRLVRRLARLS